MIIATAVAITTCLIVFVLTGVSLRIAFSRLNYRSSQTQAYQQVSCRDSEDDLTCATDEETPPSPYTNLTLAVAVVIGFVSAVFALLPTAQGTTRRTFYGLDPSRCIDVAAQALITCQSALFLRARSMEQRFQIGICIAISSFAVLSALALLDYHIASRRILSSVWPDAIHAVSCCVVGIAALAVPRGVTMYYNGQEVDRQHSVSAIQKCEIQTSF
jgi:hypothetical protein